MLALRPRPPTAEAVTRRAFLAALKSELPRALRDLQQGSIAPVDFAQAAIGPGMAVFSRYRTVVEADGSAMTVRTALALINHALDEVLTEQEGDFDADTRFCVKWFTQFGWDETDFGHADQLSRSTNTSVDGLVRGGVFWARAGRARLLAPDDLSDGWNPLTDDRISVWEAVVRLGKTLDQQGGEEAARLMGAVAQRVDLDTAKELAYLLFAICEKKKWTDTALLFNGLGTSWSDLSAVARAGGSRTPPPAHRAWSSPPGIRADNGCTHPTHANARRRTGTSGGDLGAGRALRRERHPRFRLGRPRGCRRAQRSRPARRRTPRSRVAGLERLCRRGRRPDAGADAGRDGERTQGAHPGSGDCRGGAGVKSDRERLLDILDATAVSYTHLTLPTNREV